MAFNPKIPITESHIQGGNNIKKPGDIDIKKNDGWGDFDVKKNDGWGEFVPGVNQPKKVVEQKYIPKNQYIPNKNVQPPKNLLQNPQKNQQKPKENNNKPPDTKSQVKLKDNIRQAIVSQKPDVKWDDVAGLQNAKAALKQAVLLPIKFPELFTGARKPWKGILLYGPPGTGKTFLAKACANQADATFFSVSSSDLMSKYVGQSEKQIKQLFAMARQKKPSIIFVDEIDSMCGSRVEGQNESSRRVKTQFMVQLQGVGKDDDGVLFLGATNLPYSLDPAMRRRFQKKIYISLPEKDARFHMLVNGFKKNPHQITQANFKVIAQKTQNFSGSDISNLIQDAVYEPIRFFQSAERFRKLPNGHYVPCDKTYSGSDAIKITWQNIPKGQIQVPPITFKDLQNALKKVKPTVSQAQLKQYENFTAQFGQQG